MPVTRSTLNHTEQFRNCATSSKSGRRSSTRQLRLYSQNVTCGRHRITVSILRANSAEYTSPDENQRKCITPLRLTSRTSLRANPVFGDFGCDLVVGDSLNRSYGFIEREDAAAGCLFRQQGRKATPEWATRFEHGLSQVIDWFWKLYEMAHTEEYEERFGSRRTSYFGLLVLGRNSHLAHPREQRRWHWRAAKVLVNSLPIRFLTYDQLDADLASELDEYPPPRHDPS